MLAKVSRFVSEDFSESERNRTLDAMKACDMSCIQDLLQFWEDSSLDSKKFSGLSSQERAKIHEFCSGLGLSSCSSGSKSKRVLEVQKSIAKDSNGEITETYFYNGYIGLKGPYVEHCAKNNIDDVSKIYLENRVRRDGREHHITILSKSEISMLMDMNSKSKSQTKEYVQELLTKLQSNVCDNWIDKGLGNYTNKKSKTYFKVIEWENANDFRKELGLHEATFHITVGFDPTDIHGVAKDSSCLK